MLTSNSWLSVCVVRFGNVSKFLSVCSVRWGAFLGAGKCCCLSFCCCATCCMYSAPRIPVCFMFTLRTQRVRNKSTLTTAPQSSNACTHLHTPPGGKQHLPRGSPIDPLRCCSRLRTHFPVLPPDGKSVRNKRAQGSNTGRDSSPVFFSCAITPAARPSTPKLLLTVLLGLKPLIA